MTKTIQVRTVLFLAWCVVVCGGFRVMFPFGNIVAQPSSAQTIVAPLIAIYFLWTERSAIFTRSRYSLRRATGVAVPAAIAFCGAFLVLPSHPLLGYFIAAGSVAALIAAGFIATYGEEALKQAAFPLALLVLMLPLPSVVIDAVIHGLQVGSTYLSEELFALLGVPVFRNGFTLSIPGVNIEVAKECSGINSTFALLFTMLLVARQTLHTFWPRLALLLIVLPLSIVKNAVRIVTLTLLAVKVDPRFLTGRLHHQGGVVFYLLALALMAPVLWLLRKTERPNGKAFVRPADAATLAQ